MLSLDSAFNIVQLVLRYPYLCNVSSLEYSNQLTYCDETLKKDLHSQLVSAEETPYLAKNGQAKDKQQAPAYR